MVLQRELYERYICFPRGLPLHRREAFRKRALQALARLARKRGPEALAVPLMRRRLLGGLASALKGGRGASSKWGRSRLGRRGAKALLRKITKEGGSAGPTFRSQRVVRGPRVFRQHGADRENGGTARPFRPLTGGRSARPERSARGTSTGH